VEEKENDRQENKFTARRSQFNAGTKFHFLSVNVKNLIHLAEINKNPVSGFDVRGFLGSSSGSEIVTLQN